jgi:hypothetical protein
MIELTTPEGKILIDSNRIEAIAETNRIKGINDTWILVQIYCRGGREPYNVVESYDEVKKKMCLKP